MTETIAFLFISILVYCFISYTINNLKIYFYLLILFSTLLILTRTISIYYPIIITFFLFLHICKKESLLKAFFNSSIYLLSIIFLILLFDNFILQIQNIFIDASQDTIKRRVQHVHCLRIPLECNKNINFETIFLKYNNSFFNFFIINCKEILVYTIEGVLKILFDPGDSSLYKYISGEYSNISRYILYTENTFINFLILIFSIDYFFSILFISGILYLFTIYIVILINTFYLKYNLFYFVFFVISIMYFILLSADHYSNSRFRFIILPFLLILVSAKFNEKK